VPVVLVSIDTLRADHLPVYGYAKVATPAIEALRKDSILFDNAVSHVPLTLPSHTTLLTGLLPPQEGVRDNLGYVLSEKPATLAGELKKRGYATGAAVSCAVLVKSTGISRGFDFYEDDIEPTSAGATASKVQRSGFETEKISEEWIRQHAGGPFFYFLHLYEPHTPYEPAEPYRSRYKDSPYDGEIATADAIVGKLLDFLRGERLYDEALVILLSDHGEGLGDHGEDEHGAFLYRETLHVPLIVKLPASRRRGSHVARPVGLVDVFPTVAAVVGMPVPRGLAGSSLLEAAEKFPGRQIYSETLFPRYHYGLSDLASLTGARYEYIHAPREELYDFVDDPGELKDLASGLPPAFRSMRNELMAMERPRQPPGASDPEQVKKLAALGYLGSASVAESEENLPDPKDHIQELRQLKLAEKLSSEHKYGEMEVALRQILKTNPRLVAAWSSLATALHKLGRKEAAILALEEADRLVPGSPETLGHLATGYLELNDFQNARLEAQRAIAAGGSAEAHEVLAAVYFHDRNYDGAEQEANKAKEGYLGDRRPLLRVVLALVANTRGDYKQALSLLDAVKADGQAGRAVLVKMEGLEFQRATALMRLGRAAEAEAALREELANFPDNREAGRALAALLASEGRQEEANNSPAEMTRRVGKGAPAGPRRRRPTQGH
jgi:arylsulfatase A-like enzyme/Flp pilus assembly protein TadD